MLPVGPTKICATALSGKTELKGEVTIPDDDAPTISMTAKIEAGAPVRGVQPLTFITCLQLVLGLPAPAPPSVAATDLTTLGSLAETWRDSPGKDVLQVGFPDPTASPLQYRTVQNFQVGHANGSDRAQVLQDWCAANRACVECRSSHRYEAQWDVSLRPNGPVKWTDMPGDYPAPQRGADNAFIIASPFYAYDGSGTRIYALCDPGNAVSVERTPALSRLAPG